MLLAISAVFTLPSANVLKINSEFELIAKLSQNSERPDLVCSFGLVCDKGHGSGAIDVDSLTIKSMHIWSESIGTKESFE